MSEGKSAGDPRTSFVASAGILNTATASPRETSDGGTACAEATPEHEPLLSKASARYTMYPIEHDTAWRFYKQAVASFWVVEEIDLAEDKRQFEKLKEDEQHFIKMVLAFFAGSDGIVLENLGTRFMREVQVPEVKAFYGFQVAIENIHAETYSLMIDTLISDPQEKSRLFRAIETIPCIARKAEWAEKWIQHESASFAMRLVAFACVEGIFFSGAFAAIFWLKKRGLMPGLGFSNELISRDEGLHTDYACYLYNDMLKHKLDQSTIEGIIREAVHLECEFVCDALPVALIGMNCTEMTRYIQFVADRLLLSLGHEKVYKTANPFSFMEQISLEGKSNFFEKRNSSYAKSNVMASLNDKMSKTFTMDVDF
jgi:ribonucleotide reductase beta subunit family protein with ferritin-like domain